MLRKMYLIPADRLHGDKHSPLKKRKYHTHEEQVKKRKHQPYEEQVMIRKHHPYEEWVKMRQMDEADIRRRGRMRLRIFKTSDLYLLRPG